MTLEGRHLADYRTGDDLFATANEGGEEQPADGYGEAGPDDVPAEPPFEANEADAAEQATPAFASDRADRPHVPFETNEADAAEQARVVEADDEYDRS